MVKNWSIEEVNILKHNYQNVSTKKILELLKNRTAESIRKKATELGIKRSYRGIRNKYIIDTHTTTVLIDSDTFGENKVLISTSDLELIKNHTWYVKNDKKLQGFYTYAKIKYGDEFKSIPMHRLITDCPKGLVVDHINHNTLDNRRENLKVCTHQKNMLNRNGANANSKSGIRGVSWDGECNKWKVRLMINGKSIQLGRFLSLEKAKCTAEEAYQKYNVA